MKILGIIAEYNPFHLGHAYHIQKAKEMIHPDVTIIVMSGAFVQRGEPAIINKWTRSKIAVENGADLVIELPTVWSVESADYFAYSALYLLNKMHVTDLVFGSEDGNIKTFTSIAYAINKHPDTYNQLIKQYMSEGYRYPDACNKSLNHLLNKEIRTPNDLLGLAYVKEIISHNYPIVPHCIKRTNDYHSSLISSVSSATALRKALKNNQDVYSQLPGYQYYKNNSLFDFNQFFPYLKYTVLTHNHLEDIHLADEGIDNLLKKQIMSVSSMDDLITSLSSKRYTRSRISRMLVHILLNNTKEQIKEAMHFSQIRPLAFNHIGQKYLRETKFDLPLTTKILKHNDPLYIIERKASLLLSIIDPQIIELDNKSIPYHQ